MQDKSLEYGVSVILDAFQKILKNFALVLVSRPSTGKGKLSIFLESIGFQVISCSGALTEMAESETGNPIMSKLLLDMDNGLMIEKSLVVRAIHRKLSLERGFSAIVFDGFPREHDQALDLQHILFERNIPCMVLELDCSKDQANVRRLQRIHEAHESGNPPRSEDLNEKIWLDRQVQYDERYQNLFQKLSEFAHYVKINTSKGSRKHNHSKALIEILKFANALQ